MKDKYLLFLSLIPLVGQAHRLGLQTGAVFGCHFKSVSYSTPRI